MSPSSSGLPAEKDIMGADRLPTASNSADSVPHLSSLKSLFERTTTRSDRRWRWNWEAAWETQDMAP